MLLYQPNGTLALVAFSLPDETGAGVGAGVGAAGAVAGTDAGAGAGAASGAEAGFVTGTLVLGASGMGVRVVSELDGAVRAGSLGMTGAVSSPAPNSKRLAMTNLESKSHPES